MSKLRIGLTKKIVISDYKEIIQGLDIRWDELLHSQNYIPVHLNIVNSKITKNQLKHLNLDGIILTGGNDLFTYCENNDLKKYSYLRDNYEFSVIRESIKNKIPLLGVCRGLQIINEYFGGSLIKSFGHSGTTHKIHPADSRYKKFFSNEVNSYHKFSISPKLIGKKLFPLVFDENKNIEAFHHQKYKILGIMWHPERNQKYSPEDIQLLKFFFRKNDQMFNFSSR